MRSKQSGFTLIEALIAFVVLSVGIVGTLLFHANLLADSNDNKSKLEAMAIAEKWMEVNRSQQPSTAAAMQTYISTLNESVVTGALNKYKISLISSNAHPSAQNTFQLKYQVSWPASAPTSSLSFASYLGWIDSSKVIKPEDAGVGNPGEYTGSIPIPTGTLSEVPRLEVVTGVDLDAVTTAEGSRGSDTAKVYQDGDEYKVAVKVGDKYVQLASLKSKDNEIFTITGRIYLNTGAGYRVERGFGPAYGVSSVAELALTLDETMVEGSNYYSATFDHDNDPNTENVTRYYRNNIIDMRASAGANCVISKYANGEEVNTKIKGKDYTVNYGSYGDYICVAGTGWNGTVKPYFRHYDGTNLTDIVIGDFNCAPSVKSFRYYIVETTNLTGLKAKQNYASWNDGENIASILQNTSSAIVGQSGLVRFYADETQKNLAGSKEGVFWDQYFWHNPNYLIDPDATDGADFAVTAGISGPKSLQSSQKLYLGYRGPKVTSTSSRSYDISLPGDVTHQNFYISGKGVSNSIGNCNDVLDYMVGDTPIITDVSRYPEPAQISFDGEFAKHSHLVSSGSPAYQVDGEYRGYIPSTSVASFKAADFNRETVTGEPEAAGTLILGYTLATDSVGGTITMPASVASSEFSIVGNPEPVISIICSVDVDTETIVDGTKSYSYSCAVPLTWSGQIFAYPSSSAVASGVGSCAARTDKASAGYANYFESSEVTSTALATYQIDDAVDTKYDPAIWYYFEQIVSLAYPSGTVSSAAFDPLQLYDVEVDGTQSQNNNFCYKN